MPTAAEQYTSELSEELRFLATWTPGVPLEVGMIGTIDGDNVFAPVSTLARLGVDVEPTEDGAAEESFSFASAGAVDFAFKAAGKSAELVPSVPAAQAGIGLSFTRGHATVFHAAGLRHVRAADEIKLRDDVIGLMRSQQWDRNWLLVTHVVRATSTTAIICRSQGATAEFSLAGDVTAGGIELLSAEFRPKLVASRALQIAIIASGDLTPLFRAKRPRRRFFSGRIELHAAFSDDFEKLVAGQEDDDLFDEIIVYGQL